MARGSARTVSKLNPLSKEDIAFPLLPNPLFIIMLTLAKRLAPMVIIFQSTVR